LSGSLRKAPGSAGGYLQDHLFFFLYYEGFRQTLKPLVVLTLPTQDELNGILAVDVQDPLVSGTYYKAGTKIPTSAIHLYPSG
jgi:hypothetical protein